MARILTGIQSSGRPHLGNILGAIKPAIDLSKIPGNDSFLFIADLHSLTSLRDGDTRKEYVRAIASTWLAFGIDTERTTFWRQSRVPEHTELAWYLNCFTPMPMLENATSYKDKVAKLTADGGSANTSNAGLFTYPVLQAADILLYDAELIPVGKDQRQHIEMTRDIAGAVNRSVGEDILVLPEARIDERLMVIPGIDGAKMSKSYNNYIDIFLPENELYKVVKKIKSDSTPLEAPKNPATDITFQLYSLLASEEQIAQMRSNYEGGNYGYGTAKKAFYELLLERFGSERERFNYYMTNNDALEAELQAGEEKARAVARQTIQRVRQKLGFI
ncbi:tryptophan--tRNA ligase [Spirosoma utsteinense]|uniref:Tryptophan--tRNA ligase n=1 Tax=Spirosoma utsteinense TaxID=2585773 RepID=A0ABR6W6C6_9BACT|nr:tryptophan--tRNA ligase [Spirosoma utsteinense]MBC3785613.1 tryptophanyl-tRNA synthetase [Spirosoma utsteinense]MBC3791764.1 tryptophanyl-tRNA synthetase [Spirosoma utsteinense]